MPTNKWITNQNKMLQEPQSLYFHTSMCGKDQIQTVLHCLRYSIRFPERKPSPETVTSATVTA
jgi:hypothetical protein